MAGSLLGSLSNDRNRKDPRIDHRTSGPFDDSIGGTHEYSGSTPSLHRFSRTTYKLARGSHERVVFGGPGYGV
jgi:hypothetical protein